MDLKRASSLPWLTADGQGNALAVRTQQSDIAGTTTVFSTDIVSARFLGATYTWQNAIHASSAFGGYRYPEAATLADGSAVTTWQRTIRPTIKSLSVDRIFRTTFSESQRASRLSGA